jgi:hypothetical protein
VAVEVGLLGIGAEELDAVGVGPGVGHAHDPPNAFLAAPDGGVALAGSRGNGDEREEDGGSSAVRGKQIGSGRRRMRRRSASGKGREEGGGGSQVSDFARKVDPFIFISSSVDSRVAEQRRWSRRHGRRTR